MSTNPKAAAAIARGKAGQPKWGDEGFITADLYRLVDALDKRVKALEFNAHARGVKLS